MRVIAFVCLLSLAACGGGGGPAGGGGGGDFVAATINGQAWRVPGVATPDPISAIMLIISGYTPLPGVYGPIDQSKPYLNIGFIGLVPTPDRYEIAPMTSAAAAYWLDGTHPYQALTGEVIVTSIDATRMAGTFDFIATAPGSIAALYTFTDGSFSVPIQTLASP